MTVAELEHGRGGPGISSREITEWKQHFAISAQEMKDTANGGTPDGSVKIKTMGGSVEVG